MIKAIPTVHNGTKYRSRTEARWAVFFENEGIPFTYEPEGYQTFAGWYVPDFQLTAAPALTFFEVKPHEPTRREMEVATALARGAKANVFIALGAPAVRTPIWKVHKSGDSAPWFFAAETDGAAAFLTDSLWLGTQILKIRDCEGTADIGGVGPMAALEKAGSHQFALFEGKTDPVRPAASDWRQRTRAAENRKFKEAFGYVPRAAKRRTPYG